MMAGLRYYFMLLYCATTNPGKLREFRLAFLDSGISLQPLPDLDRIPAPAETGSTFEENAVAKALYYSKHSDGPVFADDSGLEVGALGGEPGVHSARFAGPGASDAENNRLLLERMSGVQDRAARFVCSMALASSGKLLRAFAAAVEGRLLESAQGSHGFGYDPLFYYPPFRCSFGQAPPERKMEVSHRGQALRAMLACLRSGASTESIRSASSHQ